MSGEGSRLVSFSVEGFDIFLNVLHKTYGSAGDAMIYDMSVKYGEALTERNLPQIPDSVGEKINAVKILGERFENQGWGRLSTVEVNMNGEIIVLMGRISRSSPATARMRIPRASSSGASWRGSSEGSSRNRPA